MPAIYLCDKCNERVDSVNAHSCGWHIDYKKGDLIEVLCKRCNFIKIRNKRRMRMKCVKDSKGKITRVSEDIAYERVQTGNYTYCSKSEMKKVKVQKADKGV